ncbi:MAG: hypothetical protein N2486_02135 [Caloramator sp.]|nr:hypothetical protein [Caloramator sp.]
MATVFKTYSLSTISKDTLRNMFNDFANNSNIIESATNFGTSGISIILRKDKYVKIGISSFSSGMYPEDIRLYDYGASSDNYRYIVYNSTTTWSLNGASANFYFFEINSEILIITYSYPNGRGNLLTILSKPSHTYFAKNCVTYGSSEGCLVVNGVFNTAAPRLFGAPAIYNNIFPTPNGERYLASNVYYLNTVEGVISQIPYKIVFYTPPQFFYEKSNSYIISNVFFAIEIPK